MATMPNPRGSAPQSSSSSYYDPNANWSWINQNSAGYPSTSYPHLVGSTQQLAGHPTAQAPYYLPSSIQQPYAAFAPQNPPPTAIEKRKSPRASRKPPTSSVPTPPTSSPETMSFSKRLASGLRTRTRRSNSVDDAIPILPLSAAASAPPYTQQFQSAVYNPSQPQGQYVMQGGYMMWVPYPATAPSTAPTTVPIFGAPGLLQPVPIPNAPQDHGPRHGPGEDKNGPVIPQFGGASPRSAGTPSSASTSSTKQEAPSRRKKSPSAPPPTVPILTVSPPEDSPIERAAPAAAEPGQSPPPPELSSFLSPDAAEDIPLPSTSTIPGVTYPRSPTASSASVRRKTVPRTIDSDEQAKSPQNIPLPMSPPNHGEVHSPSRRHVPLHFSPTREPSPQLRKPPSTSNLSIALSQGGGSRSSSSNTTGQGIIPASPPRSPRIGVSGSGVGEDGLPSLSSMLQALDESVSSEAEGSPPRRRTSSKKSRRAKSPLGRGISAQALESPPAIVPLALPVDSGQGFISEAMSSPTEPILPPGVDVGLSTTPPRIVRSKTRSPEKPRRRRDAEAIDEGTSPPRRPKARRAYTLQYAPAPGSSSRWVYPAPSNVVAPEIAKISRVRGRERENAREASPRREPQQQEYGHEQEQEPEPEPEPESPSSPIMIPSTATPTAAGDRAVTAQRAADPLSPSSSQATATPLQTAAAAAARSSASRTVAPQRVPKTSFFGSVAPNAGRAEQASSTGTSLTSRVRPSLFASVAPRSGSSPKPLQSQTVDQSQHYSDGQARDSAPSPIPFPASASAPQPSPVSRPNFVSRLINRRKLPPVKPIVVTPDAPIIPYGTPSKRNRDASAYKPAYGGGRSSGEQTAVELGGLGADDIRPPSLTPSDLTASTTTVATPTSGRSIWGSSTSPPASYGRKGPGGLTVRVVDPSNPNRKDPPIIPLSKLDTRGLGNHTREAPSPTESVFRERKFSMTGVFGARNRSRERPQQQTRARVDSDASGYRAVLPGGRLRTRSRSGSNPFPPPKLTQFTDSPDDPLFALSTRSPHSVFYRKRLYPSAEHLFQAMRFLPNSNTLPALNWGGGSGGIAAERERIAAEIRRTALPEEVVELARNSAEFQRADWSKVRLDKMEDILTLKFTQHESLMHLLVSTHPTQLVWVTDRDSFFGLGSNGEGRNELGKLLVRVREKLMAEGSR